MTLPNRIRLPLQEELANAHMSKMRGLQQQLEDADERASQAENALQKVSTNVTNDKKET